MLTLASRIARTQELPGAPPRLPLLLPGRKKSSVLLAEDWRIRFPQYSSVTYSITLIAADLLRENVAPLFFPIVFSLALP